MRLIDADALIEDIRKRPYIDKALSEIFKTIIDEQPIAYDVEKVVREINICSGRGYRDVDGDYVPPMIKTEEVVDIVKRGGAECDTK